MASFLHDRALVVICRWHGVLCLRQWLLEVFLGPFRHVNERIMAMSDAVSSEGPKTTGIQQRSSALSLKHSDLSSFSESFDDVTHCRWWDLQSLCNLALRKVVFKVFHSLFTHSFTDWRASVHLYFWEILSLWDNPFKAIHVKDLKSINLISCKMFYKLNLFKMSCFFSPLLPRANFFETCSRHQIWKELIWWIKV